MQRNPCVDRAVLSSHLARGWVLVPVRGRAAGTGWTRATETPTDAQVDAWLADGAPGLRGPATGLGLYHGASGTADVDCDCAEAAALAPHLLPRTGAWWSRPIPEGGVRAHYLYRCPDARYVSGDRICELLAGRKQSVLPGSWHEKTGDVIVWGDSGEPAEVEAPALEGVVLEIKVGVVLGRRLREGRGERHEIFLAAVGALAQAGWAFERVEALSQAWVAEGFLDFVPNSLGTTYERHAGARTVTQWGALRQYLGEDVQRVRAWAYRVGGKEAATSDVDDSRAVIDLTGRVHLGTDLASVCEELAGAAGIWVGPGGLSTICDTKIVPLTRDTLRVEVSRRVHFRKVGQRGVKSVMPPNELLGALVDAGSWDLPRLDRVCSTPVLRRDGSVASEPGYDERTRSFLTDEVRGCRAIGSTRGEALEALQALRELVVESPFADELARDAWVAGVLTECAGALLQDEATPAWWVEANSQGAGKSTLAAMALTIGRGGRVAPIVATDRGVIDERALSAALLTGSAIFVDNFVGRLNDPTLAALVTSGRALIRKYHTQQMVEGCLHGRAIWVTTNGGTYGADWARRVVPVQLVLRTGKAIDKEWSVRNPLALTLELRGELHGAALTVLRAYLLSGQRQRVRWFGFEPWADLVLGALQWLGAGDLSVLQRTVAAEYDDETEGTERLLEALADYLESVGLEDVTARALADEGHVLKAQDGKYRENLRGVLRELAGVRSGDSLSARRVAYVLRAHGRPVGTRRISHTRTVRGDRFWGICDESANEQN